MSTRSLRPLLRMAVTRDDRPRSRAPFRGWRGPRLQPTDFGAGGVIGALPDPDRFLSLGDFSFDRPAPFDPGGVGYLEIGHLGVEAADLRLMLCCGIS